MKKLLWFIAFSVLSAATFADTTPPVATASKPAAHATKKNEESIDQIVAIVNDDVVTKLELNQAIATAKAQIAQNNISAPNDEILKKQVLDQLINKKLQLQLAKQNNVEVKDAELDKAIKQIAGQNNMTVDEMYQRLSQDGMTKEAYRSEIRDQITIHKLQQQEIASKMTITPDEVASFTRSKAWQKNSAKEYHLEDILIPLSEAPTTEEITEAYKRASSLVDRIKRGESFQQASQTESGSTNALQGGDLGWRQLPQLPTEFADKVIHMQPNEIAGPIQTPNGFHIILLADTRMASAFQGKPTRKQIENLLLEQKYEESVQNWVSKLRSQAFIVTNPEGKRNG